MALRIQEVPEVDKIEYAANQEKHVRLDRTSLFRRYTCKVNFTITTGSTAFRASAVKRHGLLNIIKKMRHEIGSGDLKFSLSGIDKFYKDWFELGIKPYMDDLTDVAANSSKTFSIYFLFDFAAARRVMSDFSQLFNAPAMQSNDLYFEWGSINDLYASGNAPNDIEIDADKTNVEISTLRVFEDGSSPVQIEDVLNNLVDPHIGVEQFPIDHAHTSFDDSIQRIPINPTRTLIVSQMVFALKNITDGNPEFSNDVIPELKWVNVLGGGEVIIQNRFEHIHAANRIDFKLFDHPNGVIYMDWPDQRQGGLRNNRAEDLEIRLKTLMPDAGKQNAIRILYTFYPLA